MDNEFESKEFSCTKLRAFEISFVCIFTYLISYILRNIISVYNPQLIESGKFTATMTATLTSTYMIVYAVGQLFNGTIGDYIKPKYMIAMGLLITGVALVIFPLFDVFILQVFCFAFIGFGLSMLRGPLVKVISENTMPNQARIACVFLSFVSYLGVFIVSFFSMVFNYKTAFFVSCGIALGMAVFNYLCITIFEKKGYVRYDRISGNSSNKFSLKSLVSVFKLDRFFFYFFIAMIIEVSASSITHWITLYLTERLNYSPEIASVIYSFMAFFRACSPFICLFLFKLFRNDDVKIMNIMFLISVLLYVSMIFISNIYLNIICFVLAMIATGICGSTIWSIYIPGLAKSGKVSGVNGMLDCAGYFAAALMNMLFSLIYNSFNWNGMIISWGALMLIGFVLSLFGKKRQPLKETENN